MMNVITELKALDARHAVGVCTSLSARLVPALQRLGVSRLRVVVVAQSDVDAIKAMLALWDGLRFNILVMAYTFNPTTWNQQIGLIKQVQATGALESIECPNEQNAFPTHGPGVTVQYSGNDQIKAGMLAWTKAIRAAFPGVPLYSGTVVAWSAADYAAMVPNVAGLATHTAFHKYPAPGGNLCNDDGQGNSPERQGSLPWVVRWATAASGVAPAVLTETGCPGAAVVQNGVVDLQTQAKTVLNCVLDALAMGLHRVFIYDLISALDPANTGGSEAHYGLLNNDLTPKPAALALGRFQALLLDATSSFASKPLAIAVSGMDKTASAAGAYLAFRRSDGIDLVAVWNEPLLSNPHPLPVIVGWGQQRRYTVIDLIDGSVVTSVGASGSAALVLSGYPMVIRLLP